MLYVLYEVLSGTPVAGVQLEHANTAEELVRWLQPYQALPYRVLATLSDGEDAIIATLTQCWPEAPRQRCQEHFLANLAEPVLAVEAQLRQRMRDALGGLPAVPDTPDVGAVGDAGAPFPVAPPLFRIGQPCATPS